MMNCEEMYVIGLGLMGIAVLMAVFFLCFFTWKKKRLHQKLEQEYGKLKK